MTKPTKKDLAEIRKSMDETFYPLPITHEAMPKGLEDAALSSFAASMGIHLAWTHGRTHGLHAGLLARLMLVKTVGHAHAHAMLDSRRVEAFDAANGGKPLEERHAAYQEMATDLLGTMIADLAPAILKWSTVLVQRNLHDPVIARGDVQVIAVQADDDDDDAEEGAEAGPQVH